MMPVKFPGAVEVHRPTDMTDEQCTSIWALYGFDKLMQIFEGSAPVPPGMIAGIDEDKFPFFVTAWQPNKEDIEAINRGGPVYIKTLSQRLPPMSLFTLDEQGEGNF